MRVEGGESQIGPMAASLSICDHSEGEGRVGMGKQAGFWEWYRHHLSKEKLLEGA